MVMIGLAVVGFVDIGRGYMCFLGVVFIERELEGFPVAVALGTLVLARISGVDLAVLSLEECSMISYLE
jgi:hypothetical protein